MAATAVMLVLAHVIGPKRHGEVKDSPYESGMPIVVGTERRFHIRFYTVAMLFLLTRGRQTDVASMRPEPAASPRQLASVDLPGGGRISVDQGSSVHQLSTYLADSAAGGIPKRFVFDDLHFETGTTRLTSQGQRTVESLAAVLKAYPTVRVTLEGHTDATGDPASNKTLSSQRAGAVKQMLTNAGIAADRLQAEGYGQERPIASNDTETGRARNRRLELVVVAR